MNEQRITDQASVHVLLMEEDHVLCKMIVKMLTKNQIAVATANGPDAAVKLYMDAKTKGQSFDSVILDLNVYGETVAVRVLKKLKQIDPDVKALVSSGCLFDDVMVNYNKFGFQGALAKPFRKHELLAVVRAMIE